MSSSDDQKSRPWSASESPNSRSDFQYPLDAISDSSVHWERCRKLVNEHDEDRCKRWESEINNVLIFASLFSAVVTAFVMEVIKLIQEDPQATTALLLLHMSTNFTSTQSPDEPRFSTTLAPFTLTDQAVRINTLVILSLVLALTTVLLGILCLQWIREYQKKEDLSSQQYLKLRQVRYEGLEKWKVPHMVSLLPVLLIAALVLFFAGLVDFLAHLHRTVAIIVGVTVGGAVLLLILTTIMPSIVLFSNIATMRKDQPAPPQCPYKSSQSWAFFRLFYSPFSLLLSLQGRRWGDMEPRRFYSRFKNLEQAVLCENWSHYDVLSKFLQLVDIDSSLSWVARTFNQTYSTVVAIHRCFQDIEVRKVWAAYWRINGRPSRQSTTELGGKSINQRIARDMASEAIISHFSGSAEVRHTASFLSHRLELYNRVIESRSSFAEHEDVRDYKPECPDLSWREYGLSVTPTVSPDLRLRTLRNLLNLLEDLQHTLQYSEIRTALNLLFWALSETSLTADTFSALMRDTCYSFRCRIADTNSPTSNDCISSKPSITQTYLCTAFHEQIVYPIAYTQVRTLPLLTTRLHELVNDGDFEECIKGLRVMKPFFDADSRPWQVHAWGVFVHVANLKPPSPSGVGALGTISHEAIDDSRPVNTAPSLLLPPNYCPGERPYLNVIASASTSANTNARTTSTTVITKHLPTFFSSAPTVNNYTTRAQYRRSILCGYDEHSELVAYIQSQPQSHLQYWYQFEGDSQSQSRQPVSRTSLPDSESELISPALTVTATSTTNSNSAYVNSGSTMNSTPLNVHADLESGPAALSRLTFADHNSGSYHSLEQDLDVVFTLHMADHSRTTVYSSMNPGRQPT